MRIEDVAQSAHRNDVVARGHDGVERHLGGSGRVLEGPCDGAVGGSSRGPGARGRAVDEARSVRGVLAVGPYNEGVAAREGRAVEGCEGCAGCAFGPSIGHFFDGCGRGCGARTDIARHVYGLVVANGQKKVCRGDGSRGHVPESRGRCEDLFGPRVPTVVADCQHALICGHDTRVIAS